MIFVGLTAKEGQEEHINNLWRAEFQRDPNAREFLIFTKEIIKKDIRDIKDGHKKNLLHLADLLTDINSWGLIFPNMKKGNGQLTIPRVKKFSIEEFKSLWSQVQFIFENQFLFSDIKSLNEAQEYIGRRLLQHSSQDLFFLQNSALSSFKNPAA